MCIYIYIHTHVYVGLGKGRMGSALRGSLRGSRESPAESQTLAAQSGALKPCATNSARA